ncbi:MAG TPA: hypothetical protein VJ890_20570 [Vineibacter sp.]|nr:hypothetical protein [Vineibacter sp.]
MLRNDTLSTIKSAIARGEPVVPTPEQVRALQGEAHRLRAAEIGRLWNSFIAWMHRPTSLPNGKIDVVIGH